MSLSQPRLTVAHFLPWAGVGGVEIATLRVIEATRDRFDHVAFCLEGGDAVQQLFLNAGLQIFSYDPPDPSLRRGLKFLAESKRIARAIRRAGAQIVHFADVNAAYHNGLAAQLAGARRICHVRVSNPRLSVRLKLGMLPVQSYVFVSREAMETFAIPLAPRRKRVVYDAIDIPEGDCTKTSTATRRELGIPDSAPIVGMLARVSPQKDYFTLADAAVEILARFPETRFLIVGDNANVDLNRAHYLEVMERLRQFGIASKFIFAGHRDDVRPFISVMDIAVLPTHREGFPLSILETMSYAKPVIATAVGGIPEIIVPGLNGYLHQHENSQELAASVIDLIANPEKARQMGLAAREHVRTNYSGERFAAEITQAYLDIMKVPRWL